MEGTNVTTLELSSRAQTCMGFVGLVSDFVNHTSHVIMDHQNTGGFEFMYSALALGVCLTASLIAGLFGIISLKIGHSRERKDSISNCSQYNKTSDIGSTCSRVHAKLKSSTVPVSVNYHFTRQCNYSCGFCFHTAKSSFVLPLEKAKQGLRMLAKAGMEKINFSGGEPFLERRGEYVGELVKYCKQILEMPSVSIVSNGSQIREKWFIKYGEYLDILAVSCDSFYPETNAIIGRQQGQKNHLDSLARVRNWCSSYKVAFKLNTVVNTYNQEEDMSDGVEQLNPVRWKVFQCLLLEGENCGDDAKRNAERYVISEADFRDFLDRHSHLNCLVPESNEKMQNSYLILDECMRFLDCSTGAKVPSPSILDVGVEAAMDRSGFDEKMFYKRGGRYEWSKADMKLDW